MFLHSGKWGGGEANVYNVDNASQNLQIMWEKDPYFLILLVVSFLLSIALLILKRGKNDPLLQRKIKALLGVSTMLLVSVAMVTKHFTMHYYYPTLFFFNLLIYQVFDLIFYFVRAWKFKIAIPVAAFMMSLIFSIMQIPDLAYSVNKQRESADNMEMRNFKVHQYVSEDDLVITSHNFGGSPFVTSGLNDALLSSGPLKTTFADRLREMYPNYYCYYYWTPDFYKWDLFLKVKEFAEPGKPIFIYIGERKEGDLDKIVGRFKKAFPDYTTQLTLIEKFQPEPEYLYRLDIVDTKTAE